MWRETHLWPLFSCYKILIKYLVLFCCQTLHALFLSSISKGTFKFFDCRVDCSLNFNVIVFVKGTENVLDYLVSWMRLSLRYMGILLLCRWQKQCWKVPVSRNLGSRIPLAVVVDNGKWSWQMSYNFDSFIKSVRTRTRGKASETSRGHCLSGCSLSGYASTPISFTPVLRHVSRLFVIQVITGREPFNLEVIIIKIHIHLDAHYR